MSDERWITLGEDDFNAYKESQNSHEERWDMVKSFCPLGSKVVEEDRRLKIIFEIFSQALEFCTDNNVSFGAAEVLIELIQRELSLLAISEPSNLEFSFEAPPDELYSRYTDTMKELTVDIDLSVRDAKMIAKFYTNNVVRNIDAYQFILQNETSEKSQTMYLQVFTPTLKSASNS